MAVAVKVSGDSRIIPVSDAAARPHFTATTLRHHAAGSAGMHQQSHSLANDMDAGHAIIMAGGREVFFPLLSTHENHFIVVAIARKAGRENASAQHNHIRAHGNK